MARPKTNMKGDVVSCKECSRTYEIALDKQKAYCTGKRTEASVAHAKHVRMQ
jgi:hypothetical protein